MTECQTLFSILNSHYKYEKILDRHEELKALIDTERFQVLVHEALGTQVSDGKPIYWFEAVVTVNWEVFKLILDGDVSYDKQLTAWKKMFQTLFFNCSQYEKDFLTLVIIHHTLLRLFKNKLVQFKHVQHCDAYLSGGNC
jgi:hypothetical protein